MSLEAVSAVETNKSSSMSNSFDKNNSDCGNGCAVAKNHRNGRCIVPCFLQKLLAKFKISLNSEDPAATQKTPLNLNRFVLLIIYVFYSILTASCYFGWPPMASMIFRNEGFSTLCPKDPNNENEFLNDQRKEGKQYICDKQEADVQTLFSITLATHTTMSAFAGILLDHVGPKYTALFGQVLNAASWLTLSFGGSSPSLYYPAFILMGLGADTGFLPTLVASRMFPGSTGLVLTILGSAASGSFAIPGILNSIWINNYDKLTFKSLNLIYMGFGPSLCFLIALTFIPRKNYMSSEEFEVKKQLNGINDESKKDIKERNNSYTIEDAANNDSNSLCNNGEHSERLTNNEKCGPTNEKFLNSQNKIVEVPFLKQFFSERYFLIVIYFIVVNISSAYYMQAPDRMFNPNVVSVLNTLLPLSFIPCIILGKFADMVGILPVIFIINSCGLFMYIFALIPNIPCWYVSITCFTIYMSLFTSQIYCYIATTFPPKHFGKLIGLCSLLGGLFALVSNPLYGEITIGLNGGNTTIMKIVFVVVLFLTFFGIFRMMYLRMKRRTPFQTTVKCLDLSCKEIKTPASNDFSLVDNVTLSSNYEKDSNIKANNESDFSVDGATLSTNYEKDSNIKANNESKNDNEDI